MGDSYFQLICNPRYPRNSRKKTKSKSPAKIKPKPKYIHIWWKNWIMCCTSIVRPRDLSLWYVLIRLMCSFIYSLPPAVTCGLCCYLRIKISCTLRMNTRASKTTNPQVEQVRKTPPQSPSPSGSLSTSPSTPLTPAERAAIALQSLEQDLASALEALAFPSDSSDDTAYP